VIAVVTLLPAFQEEMPPDALNVTFCATVWPLATILVGKPEL
jgi:hypothetical protein